ncbi:MAG TPA: hypothetical protein DIU20_09465 [Cryomorphaceae bacterium]|nr:hypothetical protein [Owenweeksia sp.]HCQ16478.1 hypothetical protein [Cryomorphaceae bacterium]
MSWIDKKYKEELGEQNFPESLKQKGWADMENMLDAEMPVTGGGSRGGQLWMAVRIFSVLLILLLPLAWYMGFFDGDPAATEGPAVEQSPVVSHEEEAAPAPEEAAAGDVDALAGHEVAAEISTENEVAGSTEVEATTGPEKSKDKPGVAQQDNSPAGQPGSFAGTSGEQATVAGKSPIVTADNTPSGDDDPFTASREEDEPDTRITDRELAVTGTEPVIANPTTGDDQVVDNNPAETADPKTTEKLDAVATATEQEAESRPEEGAVTAEATNAVNETASENEAPKASFKRAHLAFPQLAETDVLTQSAEDEEKLSLFSRERFSVSIWGGYAYTGKLLEADEAGYLEKRQAEEEAIRSIPTGVNLDYFFNSNWTFGLGIGWNEYGEDLQYNFNRRDTVLLDGRFNSPDEYTNVVSVDSTRVIDGILQGHWEYTVVYDYQDTVSEKNNGRTSWRYIEIPLTVGYRFGNGRVKPWVRTGIALGIPVQTSFRYIRPGYAGILDNEENGQLVAPLQYSALFNVGVDWYLARNFSLRLNGFGSMQLNSSLVQDGVRQRYYQLGVSLGAAYNF